MSGAIRPRLCWCGPGDAAAALIEPLTERVDVIVLDGPPDDAWCAAEAAVADCTVVHPRHLDDRPATCAAVRRLVLDLLDGTSAASVWAAHVERADLLLFADENQAVVITDRLAADGVRVPPWRVLQGEAPAEPLAEWCYGTEAEASGEVGPAPSRVDQLQASLQALVEELELRGRRIDELDTALQAAQEQLAGREAELQSGQQKLQQQWDRREQALQETAGALEAQLRATEAELQETRDRAEALESTRALMEAERDGLAADAEELRAAAEAAEDEAAERLAAAADEAAALQARIAELQGAQGAAAQSSAAQAEMAEALALAERRLKEARDNEVRAAAARADSEAQLSLVRAQLAQAQQTAQAQERRLNAIRWIPGVRFMWRLLRRGD